MKLNLEQIRTVTKGVEDVQYEEGMFRFYRFSEEEEKVIYNPNVHATAGVQMEFHTDAQELKLKVNTKKASDIRSYFAFDIFLNRTYLGSIKNFDDGINGDYANGQYTVGDFEGNFNLGEHKKSIKIVFPHSVIASIIELELVGATFIEPINRKKSIIFYGDSITQGYDSLHPSKTYANLLSESLEADVMNKALGGAVFFPQLVAVQNNYTPDYVIVAYGTNDWYWYGKEEVRDTSSRFLNNATMNYPNSSIVVISPIWRKNHMEYKKFGLFLEMEKLIEGLCQNRKNLSFVSGYELVPHEEDCFGDLHVHPSDKGFDYYHKNLCKHITRV